MFERREAESFVESSSTPAEWHRPMDLCSDWDEAINRHVLQAQANLKSSRESPLRQFSHPVAESPTVHFTSHVTDNEGQWRWQMGRLR